MIFAGSLILPLAVVALGVLMICRDPAGEHRPRRRRPPFAQVAGVGRSLPADLLDGRLLTYRVVGTTPDGRHERRYVVRARNAGDATLKARRWGLRGANVTRL